MKMCAKGNRFMVVLPVLINEHVITFGHFCAFFSSARCRKNVGEKHRNQ